MSPPEKKKKAQIFVTQREEIRTHIRYTDLRIHGKGKVTSCNFSGIFSVQVTSYLENAYHIQKVNYVGFIYPSLFIFILRYC